MGAESRCEFRAFGDVHVPEHACIKTPQLTVSRYPGGNRLTADEWFAHRGSVARHTAVSLHCDTAATLNTGSDCTVTLEAD